MTQKINDLDKRFAAITWDAGFKATFRDPDNSKALILLLNTFLPPERKIHSLTFPDRELDGLSPGNKVHRFDLRCKDQYGNDFIVEMQRGAFSEFMKRSMAYAAGTYSSNIDRGDSEYVSAVPVYMISFLAKKSSDPLISNSTRLVKRGWFIDDEGQSFENQFINFIFVRLYEVNNLPEPDKDTPSVERCCWLMMHLAEMDSDPDPSVVGEYGDIVEAAKIAGFDKNKKLQYKMGLDYERLQEALLREKVAEGREEGRAEGIVEGEAKGRAEGRAEANRETARNMLQMNLDVLTISKATGLSVEEIQAL